jgi:hypothetical protein
MIARAQLVARLVNFATATWILGVVIWGLIAGKQHIQTPRIAVWLFIAAALVRLLLWSVSKAATRS